MIDKLLIKPKLKIIRVGLQKADVIKTHGSNKKIINFTKFNKFTPLEIGIQNLVNLYKNSL